MKTIILLLAALLTTFLSLAQTTLSHNIDPISVNVTGLACWITDTNQYRDNHNARVYNLNEFGITGNFVVSAVTFGIGSVDDGKSFSIRIYTSDSEHLTGASLTLIAEEDFIFEEMSNHSLVSIPVSATIPAGSIVVVETFAPDEGAATDLKFFPGFNFNGETDFSWVKVPNCGAPVWRITEEFQTNQQYLINLVGDEVLGVNDLKLEDIKLSPNPTNGNFKIDLDDNYTELVVNITNIAGQQLSTSVYKNTSVLNLSIQGGAGIYFVRIFTPEGKNKTLKVVKV